MKTPKSVLLIECGTCKGCYFGGDTKVVLHPGTENEQPDEVYIITRKVSRCATCKEAGDRSRGGPRKRYEL